MRRTRFTLIAILLMLASLPACRKATSAKVLTSTGSVLGPQAECSSWYLQADDGRLFEAFDLPAEYHKAGLRVRFTVRSGPFASACMRGEPVEVITIRPL